MSLECGMTSCNDPTTSLCLLHQYECQIGESSNQTSPLNMPLKIHQASLCDDVLHVLTSAKILPVFGNGFKTTTTTKIIKFWILTSKKVIDAITIHHSLYIVASSTKQFLGDGTGAVDSNYAGSIALTLGCIHRSAGGMALSSLVPNTVNVVSALAKSSISSLQIWSLHGLLLTIEAAGLSYVSQVQATLSLVMDMILSEESGWIDLQQAVGRLINAIVAIIGPELSPGSIFFSRCKSNRELVTLPVRFFSEKNFKKPSTDSQTGRNWPKLVKKRFEQGFSKTWSSRRSSATQRSGVRDAASQCSLGGLQRHLDLVCVCVRHSYVVARQHKQDTGALYVYVSVWQCERKTEDVM
ncbi:heat repeat-containing protein 5a [Phtheirospermum japonicum]|uniref:Heat repeat-containing protein 5a n=1 Tax=Phtheirospermum japonicum TaxID=374723 RepID=A0A830CX46_9LAMI|nr:heat repeat-containing protein 5a [Phtheirospermum japonicum]